MQRLKNLESQLASAKGNASDVVDETNLLEQYRKMSNLNVSFFKKVVTISEQRDLDERFLKILLDRKALEHETV